MQNTINIMGHEVTVSRTWLDRAIEYVNPVAGAKRFRGRLAQALSGSYVGASRTRRATVNWNPREGSPNADVQYDLPTLRARSRDLVRNEPIATGAINTLVTSVIGTGLQLEPMIDAKALGMTPEEADAWEEEVEREWCLFSDSPEIDLARTSCFTDLQALAFRAMLESGDVFVLRTTAARHGSPYRTKLQLVEADRVSNPNFRTDTPALVGGVERDPNSGAPVAYHITTRHPGDLFGVVSLDWVRTQAFASKSGIWTVRHLFTPLRPGQARGVPYLAPVIETLKQLSRYTEGELMATVISSFFTVFIESESGDAPLAPMTPPGETGGSTADEDYRLGTGAIVGLAPGEKVTTANPNRPNTAFDGFITAICRQIGVALELPYEVLVKHFTASYSAARAALLEAWKMFNTRRAWMAQSFCQPVYEAFLWEAVLSGRITAPGFLSDPLIRKAYCGAAWIGPAKGMINEKDEVEAAELRVNMGISTLSRETAQLLGDDWDRTIKQRIREKKIMLDGGLDEPLVKPMTGVPVKPNLADLQDNQP